MDGWDFLMEALPWLMVLCLGFLVGAAVGYYSASKDLELERAKVREKIERDVDERIREAQEVAWDLGVHSARNPYARDDGNPFRQTETPEVPFASGAPGEDVRS